MNENCSEARVNSILSMMCKNVPKPECSLKCTKTCIFLIVYYGDRAFLTYTIASERWRCRLVFVKITDLGKDAIKPFVKF